MTEADGLEAVEVTVECIDRVTRESPASWTRAQVLNYILAAHRGNLICLDCGSENHTRGHELCRYGKDDDE